MDEASVVTSFGIPAGMDMSLARIAEYAPHTDHDCDPFADVVGFGK